MAYQPFGSTIAQRYVQAALLLALVSAALAWLAEADYVFAVVPPFMARAALIGALLALPPLPALCWLSLKVDGRWPAFGDTLTGFLISLAALPVFAVAFTAVSNSWLDRSELEMREVTVTRRWDRGHGTYSGRHFPRSMHDAYVYLAPLDPAGGELRVPGDYTSTSGLKAGDKAALAYRKGFWGLPHVFIYVP